MCTKFAHKFNYGSRVRVHSLFKSACISSFFYIHIEHCSLFKLHSAKLVPQWIVSKSLNIPEFPLMMCRWLYKTLKRGTCRHNIFVQENNNSIFCVFSKALEQLQLKKLKKKLSSKTDVESKWKTMLNICFQIIINLSFVSF